MFFAFKILSAVLKFKSNIPVFPLDAATAFSGLLCGLFIGVYSTSGFLLTYIMTYNNYKYVKKLYLLLYGFNILLSNLYYYLRCL